MDSCYVQNFAVPTITSVSLLRAAADLESSLHVEDINCLSLEQGQGLVEFNYGAQERALSKG